MEIMQTDGLEYTKNTNGVSFGAGRGCGLNREWTETNIVDSNCLSFYTQFYAHLSVHLLGSSKTFLSFVHCSLFCITPARTAISGNE
jgi:hypothetical protein